MSEPFSIDRPEDEPVYSPVCCRCLHLASVSGRRCRAFPNGIPYEIWSGVNPHTKPVEGDGGTMFKDRIGPAPICICCKRYRDPVQLGAPPTCEAFPNGIPDSILDEGFDHRTPHNGDSGIRFEQREDIEFRWSTDS